MELTEQRAKDIDRMLSFAVQHGFLESFGIQYYQQEQRPDLDKSYLIFLVGILRNYMKKYDRNWVGLDGIVLTCNHSTKEFLANGGFTKIYESEARQDLKEQLDLELAQKVLKDYHNTKRVAWLGLAIAAIVAVVEIINAINGK